MLSLYLQKENAARTEFARKDAKSLQEAAMSEKERIQLSRLTSKGG